MAMQSQQHQQHKTYKQLSDQAGKIKLNTSYSKNQTYQKQKCNFTFENTFPFLPLKQVANIWVYIFEILQIMQQEPEKKKTVREDKEEFDLKRAGLRN